MSRSETAARPATAPRAAVRVASASGLSRAGAWAAVVAASWLLAACAGFPELAPPHALLGNGGIGPASPTATAAAVPDVEWPRGNVWDNWGDTLLQSLLDRAAQRQPGLLQVQARLAQALAAADAVDAARAPQLNAAVDLSRQRFTENGLVPPPLAGHTAWNASAQLSASWEWDLFGRQRAALAAAIGQSRAASAEAQAAALLLASNVASGWVALARAVESHDITAAALDQRRRVLALVQQRIAAGLDTTVELRQAEGAIAQAQVELDAADEQAVRARHALAELTGQRPDALDGISSQTASALPPVAQPLSPRLAAVRALPLPAGLPADLLGRRADLVAQRWRVEAATQDVAVARAQFYPNINLTAFAGLSSLGLDNLLRAGSAGYGIGPALRLPVFDGGRLRADLRVRAAEVDVAVEAYNAALLRALREVADEVASLRAVERQQRAQAQALAAAESAFDLAGQRYGAGLGNFLVVLTAEANVLAQRRAAIDLKARHLTAEVALARALGGGWNDGDALASQLPAVAGPAATASAARTAPASDRSAAPDQPRNLR